jgi:hypothetical protein
MVFIVKDILEEDSTSVLKVNCISYETSSPIAFNGINLR